MINIKLKQANDKDSRHVDYNIYSHLMLEITFGEVDELR